MFCMKAEMAGNDGEHSIAGKPCQRLVCFDQAEPGQRQHDAQRHDVHAQPFADEEEDRDAKDGKGEDDLGAHVIYRTTPIGKPSCSSTLCQPYSELACTLALSTRSYSF
jgi:hypothetical protein